MLSIALLGEFWRACLMLALEGATAAFALYCHGKKKNAISLQQQPKERQQLSWGLPVHPIGPAKPVQFAPLSPQ